MKYFVFLISFIMLANCAIAHDEILLDAEPLKLATERSLPEAEPVSLPDEVFVEDNIYDTPIERQNRIYSALYKTENLQSLSKVNPLYAELLTQRFERGPLESLHEWAALQMNMTTEILEGDSVHNKYNVALVNAILEGKFRGGKEGFRILLDPTPQGDMNFFKPFIKDLYIETTRIPHHTVLFGHSRPVVGAEGSQSPYTLSFLSRSQIARHFGTVRKFGIRVHGDYSLIDYDLAGLSSDTYFTEFFPGAEFDGWVNFKPLGLTDGKYGKLTIGSGIVAGGRNATDFFVFGSYIGYEYKRLWFKAEYANANGSNGGTGLSDKKRHGWYTAAGYRVTNKLEILARYDEFDPDKSIRNNNIREYTAGINYYIKGQALKVMLNYVFCQNLSKFDSHRIVLGTQIIF